MKCLEFLYFYLLDETASSPNTHQPESYDIPTAPNSPTNSRHNRSQLSLSQLSDSSVSSDYSTSSAGSNVSVSTTATSSVSTSLPSSPTSKDVPPLAPSPSIRPIVGHTRAVSRDVSGAQPRSLMMLRKEVDFTPQTPAAKASGTPRPGHRLKQQSSDGAVVSPTDERPGEWKTPKRAPPRMQATTSIADSDPSTPALLSRPRGHRRAHTVDVQADAKSLQSSPSLTKSSISSPDRREAAVPGVSVIGNVNVMRRPVKARTMEEKKAILGSMMGNVDTLVEGVKKAGIWGLS